MKTICALKLRIVCSFYIEKLKKKVRVLLYELYVLFRCTQSSLHSMYNPRFGFIDQEVL